MRAMRAAHACELSLLARCQPTTWSFVQAMSMTALRPSQMPSTWTTWWISSQAGAMGHIRQKSSDERRKERPAPGMSAWRDGERSQARKPFRLFAVVSTLCVVVAAHDMHCHRFVPFAVLP